MRQHHARQKALPRVALVLRVAVQGLKSSLATDKIWLAPDEKVCEEIAAAVADVAASLAGGASESVGDGSYEVLDGTLALALRVRIFRDTSVRALGGALLEALRDGGPEDGALQAALSKAGVPQGQALEAEIKIVAPLGRIQAEVAERYPQYVLTEPQLGRLVQAVDTSYELMEPVWHQVVARSPAESRELCEVQSRALFTGQLLTREDGERRALKADRMAHGARELAASLADAARAQLQLKAQLAPHTRWAEDLNDAAAPEAEDRRRYWRAGADHLARHGEHYDPGLKARERVVEKALNRKRPYEAELPVEEVTDISRLCVIFDAPGELLRALRDILQELDVVWVRNTFANPCICGSRRVDVGVRQRIDLPCQAPRAHVSELQLLLRDLHEVELCARRRRGNALRCALSDFGVAAADQAGVLRIVLSTLDETDGQAAHEALQDLENVAAHVEVLRWHGEHEPDAQVSAAVPQDAPDTATQLLEAAQDEARASGVPDHLAAQATSSGGAVGRDRAAAMRAERERQLTAALADVTTHGDASSAPEQPHQSVSVPPEGAGEARAPEELEAHHRILQAEFKSLQQRYTALQQTSQERPRWLPPLPTAEASRAVPEKRPWGWWRFGAAQVGPEPEPVLPYFGGVRPLAPTEAWGAPLAPDAVRLRMVQRYHDGLPLGLPKVERLGVQREPLGPYQALPGAVATPFDMEKSFLDRSPLQGGWCSVAYTCAAEAAADLQLTGGAGIAVAVAAVAAGGVAQRSGVTPGFHILALNGDREGFQKCPGSELLQLLMTLRPYAPLALELADPALRDSRDDPTSQRPFPES